LHSISSDKRKILLIRNWFTEGNIDFHIATSSLTFVCFGIFLLFVIEISIGRFKEVYPIVITIKGLFLRIGFSIGFDYVTCMKQHFCSHTIDCIVL